MTQTITHAVPSLTTNVVVAPDATESGAPSVQEMNGSPQAQAPLVGIEGEETIWEGHYSFRNYLGRMSLGGLLTLGWVLLAVETWGLGRTGWALVTTILGVALAVFWVHLGFRLFRLYRSYSYRLTSRRLFVTTGFFHRRVDQVELIRLKDLYVRQSMIGNWLGVGTVVVITSEETLPKATLLGIKDPQRIMDLIWHHTRLEQDRKTNRIAQV
jgi:hypothetical protein